MVRIVSVLTDAAILFWLTRGLGLKLYLAIPAAILVYAAVLVTLGLLFKVEPPRSRARTARARGDLHHPLVLAVLLAPCAAAPASAGDAAAGKRKAVACQTCHGLDGLSKRPEAPNLAGQPEPYLVKALDEFRKGKRQNEMMSIVAQGLSDADAADLAAYYAAIQITAKPP